MDASTQVSANTLANTKTKSNTWILVFVFCFLALMVDGADLMLLSYSLSSLKAEFGLTSVQAGSLGSFTLAGMAIGGIYGGWACDRFGRVKTVVWGVVFFSVGTSALGLTQSYMQFAIIRLVASMGIGAVYIACSTLMSEYVPTRYRTTVLGTLQAGWSVGYILATVLASWILPTHGWRWLFFLAIIPVILAVMMQVFVPEPQTWINAQAERAKKKIEGIKKQSSGKRESMYKAIFSDPKARRMFILWALTAGFLQFGYYGVNNWLPTYLEGELGMNFKSMAGFMVLTYTAMILGKILAGLAADRIGRRAVFAFGAMGSAVFLPVIVLFQSPENILWMLVVFGFLYGIPYAVNATYLTESFEAKYRGTAVGGAYNVGRVGAAIAPTAIGYLATHGSIGVGFLIMGAAYFICGVIPALFIKDKQFDPQNQ
ncbi:MULTISPECIES: MFS transporter [Pseudomonas]|uniref:MFS transporter n=1 Tax=Pseudomonas TaxID=286 RepID=UPI001C8CC4CC|nr:MFS transporter [Pseudomonas baetica]MBX9410286.1 MFS transporter [Pseudomonas baetica]